LLNDQEKLKLLNGDWNQVAKNLFLLDADSSDRISQKIRHFYNYVGDFNPISFLTPRITKHTLRAITNALSDRFFISGVRDAAVLHSKEAPTFLYYFTYKGDFTLAPILKASIKTGVVPFFTELITEIITNKMYRLIGWDVVDYGN